MAVESRGQLSGRRVVRWVLALAFVSSVAWLVFQPSFESLVTSLVALGGLVSEIHYR